MKSLEWDSAVVRRLSSNTTHVARIGYVIKRRFIKPFWSPFDKPTVARCGARLHGDVVIMATGSTTTCRACVHASGVTEQSPAAHEKLGEPTA